MVATSPRGLCRAFILCADVVHIREMNYSFEAEFGSADRGMALTGIKHLSENIAELSGEEE